MDGNKRASETGWLVEKLMTNGNSWYLSHRCGHQHWEPIADWSTRFARREDAAAVAATIKEDGVFVAEHQWG